MSYRRRASRQYSRKAVNSFVKEFSKQHHYWRENLIRKIISKIRSANEEKLEQYYEQILGEKPEPLEVEPKITLSDDRVVAIVPAGTMNRKITDDGYLEKVRRVLVRVYRKRSKRRVKAKSMKYYKEKAKDGVVRIGKARFSVKHVISSIRTLGKDCFYYPPSKDSILILENENGDRIFIAPVAG